MNKSSQFQRIWKNGLRNIRRNIGRKHYLGKQIISRGTKKPDYSSFKWFLITLVINSKISGNEIEQILPSKYLDLEWVLKTNSIKGYEKQNSTHWWLMNHKWSYLGKDHFRNSSTDTIRIGIVQNCFWRLESNFSRSNHFLATFKYRDLK